MIVAAARRAARQTLDGARLAPYRFERAASCLCGASGARPVAARRLAGRRLALVACDACGLVRLSPRISAGSLGRYYARTYRTYPIDETRFRRGIRRGEGIRAFLAEHGKAPPEGTAVVEPGTSAGGILEVFRAMGHAVAGCDLDPQAVAYAQARGLAVVEGDTVPTGLAPAPAGLVVLSHLLEHLADPIAMLRRVAPWIGPETIVYVEVPGTRSGRPLAEQIRIPHLFYYDLGSLTRVAAEASLELVAGDERVRAIFRPVRP